VRNIVRAVAKFYLELQEEGEHVAAAV
jgi:hypothetical protein